MTFSVSTGYVGAEIKQTFDLEELGIIESEYENEKDLEKDIDEAYKDWMYENINAQWEIID